MGLLDGLLSRGGFTHSFAYAGNGNLLGGSPDTATQLSLDGLRFPADDNGLGDLAKKTRELQQRGGTSDAVSASQMWNANQAKLAQLIVQRVKDWGDQNPNFVTPMSCKAVVDKVRFEINPQTSQMDVVVVNGMVKCGQ